MNHNDNNNLLTRPDQSKNVAKKNRSIFKGTSKHAPINISTLGLRRSPRIDNMKRKQLNLSLNHVGFIQENQVLEEEVVPMKETFTFREEMCSPYKTKLIEDVDKEIQTTPISRTGPIARRKMCLFMRH